jgi:L,D-peptidoglycan transpeptidase YkuD (ErfK/YbiS/YcfS/YnhG family)
VLLPVLTGRTRYPREERLQAELSLADAHRLEADRWAPELFTGAQSTFEAAVDEALRQKARLIPFQNLGRARDGFRCAASIGRSAGLTAALTKEATRGRALTTLVQARSAVRDAERCAALARLGMSSRNQLQRARLALAEAAARADHGDFDVALERASEARDEATAILDRTQSLTARFLDGTTVETWKQWIRETVETSRRRKETAIIVYKEKNLLQLYASGVLVRDYRADMGKNKLNPKLTAGDLATPEGRYRIIRKKGRGESKYFMALQLNYPTEADRRRLAEVRSNGLFPRQAGPGGLIEIHGDGGRGEDWTYGCVALSNPDIADLSSRVGVGTPVTIVGGDGDGSISALARRLGGNRRR